MVSKSKSNQNRFHRFDFFLALIISLISVVLVLLKDNLTAYEFQALDSVEFFERVKDSTYLVNDFFTNVSLIPNPRFVYYYFVLFLMNLFRTDWYSVFFFIKVVYVVFLPVLFYLVILSLIKARLETEREYKIASIFALLAVLFVLFDPVSYFFSIAFWWPLFLHANSQNFGIFLGLLTVLISQNKRFSPIIVTLSWAITTLFHPAIGAFMFMFYHMAIFDRIKTKRFLAILIAGILVPQLILLLFFGPKIPLSSKDFVHYYVVENLPHQYMVSHLASTIHRIPSWIINAAAMVNLMLITSLIAIRRKNLQVVKLSLIFIAAYCGSILSQFIFTEIYPVKWVAALGPIRFTLFGYWMISILFILVGVDIFKNSKFVDKFKFVVIDKKIYFLVIVLLLIVLNFLKDNPFEEARQKNAAFYNWLEKSTGDDEVFASYLSLLHFDIPIIGKRAIFFGNGWIFREDYLPEFTERKILLYGSFEENQKITGDENWIMDKWQTYYRSRTPKNFREISSNYKLDYVIVENGFRGQFSSYTPVFQNKDFSGYKVVDFSDADSARLN